MTSSIRLVLVAGLLALAAPLALARNLTVQDRLEIADLYTRYNTTIDSGDASAWADTFTPDGEFGGQFKGHDALVGFVKLWREQLHGAERRHWSNNLMLTPTAEGVTGSVYLMLLDVGVKPAQIATTGVYTDQLVKTQKGWRFKQRAATIDVPVAAPAVR